MKNELISIVMPTFNRGNIIERAINSVINQTYSNWELFIVDDASIDNTKEITSKYINADPRIQFISNIINKGANACRNQGAAIANGKYIAFIDSDNQWYPNKLLKQVEVLNANLNISFVYSKEKVVNEEYIKIVPQKAYPPDELKRILPNKNVVDTSTVIISKGCFNSVGGFDEMMPRLQDWELFFRTVVVYGHKGVCIDEVLNTNVLQEDSISKNDKKYIDAIFYMLKKHNSYFNDADLISQIVNSIKGEGEYLLHRVREVYSNDLSVMTNILEKVIYGLQNKQRQFELLYRWRLRDKNEIYKEIQNKSIAIYGLGKWGELLYKDLKGVSAQVVFGIDREVEQFYDLPVKMVCLDSFDIELIIVAVIDGASEIEKMLRPKCTGEILLLEDLIKTKK
jgi:glycosyltransferase involved in cell wall biosynthesis